MQETEQNSGVDSISVHMCVLLDFQKNWTDMRVRDVTAASDLRALGSLQVKVSALYRTLG